MEKHTPHCKLKRIFDLIALDQISATQTALSGADALELEFDDMVAVVNALVPADFYKSMTSHADHRIWQDVYRPQINTPVGKVDVYVKLTVVEDVLIISFKELSP